MKTRIQSWLLGLAAFILTFSAYAFEKGDIVGYWPADEGRGSKVADFAGGLDGTLSVGPDWDGKPHDDAWVDGKFGKGLEFNAGKSWFVLVGTNDTFDQLGKPGTAFSVAYWLKSNMTSGKGRTIEKGSSGWTQGWHAALVNGRAFSEAVDAVAPGWALHGKTNVADNKWHHVVHVFNLDTLEAKLYVDAKLDAELGVASDKDIAGIDWPIVFGALGNVPECCGGNQPLMFEFFNGTMDEMAIFSKELEVAEIEELMDHPIGDMLAVVEPTSKLAAYWGALKATR